MTALFICGPAGAGKDTVCEYLLMEGETHAWSTSTWYLTNVAVRCPMSREDFIRICGQRWWRERLAALIADYNRSDGTNCRLYREMIGAGCQAINGIRRLAELQACIDAGLVSEIWWIDASERLKDKPPDTTLDYGLEDVEALGVPFVVLDNNGTVEQLIERVKEVLSDGT